MSSTSEAVHGRLISIEPDEDCIRLTLRNLEGIHHLKVSRDALSPPSLRPGDIVSVQEGSVTRLTATLHENESRWQGRVLDPRRRAAIEVRTRVEGLIRNFFLNQDFIETRTPLLVRSPGMEIHIRPFELASGAYLPTSPEFAMKRLLVGGLERIFQIAPAFRYEPNSRTHYPEFTLLEWYRAYAGLEEIMEDTERLFEFVALALFGKAEIPWQGKTIDVTTPWPRRSVRDLFREHLGFDLAERMTIESIRIECDRLGERWSPEDTWDDLYFRLFLNHVESKLPEDRAVFVHRYPPSQAALAVVAPDPDGSRWAKRFEVYAGGLELGNAFEELTDAVEQRARFVRDMEERTKIYGDRFPPSPIDEDFLHALEEGMPPSGGIAVGIDRMVMLFANEPDIDYTHWLPPFPGTEPVPPAI